MPGALSSFMSAIQAAKTQLRHAYRRNGFWPVLAAFAAVIPFLPGLSNDRVFYVRDLSQAFWGRYLWLRRSWLSGEWPLWDPFVGTGQAAYSDALNQMFLPPAILARLAGGEVFGFNLWLALPFPLAALGAWLFFSRHFSAAAAAIGAIAFAVGGPVVSTGNTPNLSWSAAGLFWALWATDRLLCAPTPRNVAILAGTIALHALAGEPVTLFMTLCLVAGYAASRADRPDAVSLRDAARSVIVTGAGIALGLLAAAVQLVPMALASSTAGRSDAITDVWSLRPTALLETIWVHFFGNFLETRTLADVPWMPLMYTGRAPLLFSIYIGVPLLALAVFGLAGPGRRRWRLFWVIAGGVSLLLSFGAYTPVYPILRDHVPPFTLFRFPVKYFLVTAAAVAAGAAAGWDCLEGRRLASRGSGDAADARRIRRARALGVTVPAVAASSLIVFALACIYLPVSMTSFLSSFARALGDEQGGTAAAEWMLRTVDQGAATPIVMALLTTVLFALMVSRSESRISSVARTALAILIAGDLLSRAWGINPVLDVAHFAQPEWISYVKTEPHARFYVGGKRDGTLSGMDIDGSRGYLDADGLSGGASRAALNIQAAFYPSAWTAREFLTYDLPVLWPRDFADVTQRFFDSDGEVRDRVLDRAGVRYRILPQRRAGDRVPLTRIPQFYESFLFDFGDEPSDRVSIVPTAVMVPETREQIKALFDDGWDSREVVLVDRLEEPTGIPGSPVEPYARIVDDSANYTVVEAGVDSEAGYLVFLDSYADDWRATVDGEPAPIARANGLWRAVHLAPGQHLVEFHYRPRALAIGATISAASLLSILGLFVFRVRRSEVFVRTARQSGE